MRESNLPFWRSLLLGIVLIPGASSVGAPIISEFMAASDSGLADEDGEFSDWIEIYNPEERPNSAGGLSSHRRPDEPRQVDIPRDYPRGREVTWSFSPPERIARIRPDGLHTDFQLSADGEYLALVAPDGVTVVSAFSPGYSPTVRE